MFVERQVSYSALFTFLVGWHTSALSLPTPDIIFANVCGEIGQLLCSVYFFRWHLSALTLPPSDVIFVQLTCPLNDVIFCKHQELLTYLQIQGEARNLPLQCNILHSDTKFDWALNKNTLASQRSQYTHRNKHVLPEYLFIDIYDAFHATSHFTNLNINWRCFK